MGKEVTMNELMKELEDIKAHLVKLEKMTLKGALANDVLELRQRVGTLGNQIRQLQSANS